MFSVMATGSLYLGDDDYQKLAEALRLTDEEYKNDPESEPYKSKYKARDVFLEMRDKVQNCRNENPSDEHLRFLEAALCFKLGVNYIDTEELVAGEKELEQCLHQVEENKLRTDVVNIVQNVLNHLGILWGGRKEYDKALEYLKSAETLYKQYKHDVGLPPVSVSEYLSKQTQEEEELIQKRLSIFENTFTLTLYYTAQVYAHTGDVKTSARYCHTTLQRQLGSGQYDPVDWAINAATLSQCYIQRENFHYARHCLASASLIFQEAFLQTPLEMSEGEKDKLLQRKADIDRCWSKYGLALLEASRDDLMKSIETADEPRRANHNDDLKQAQQSEDAVKHDSNQEISKVEEEEKFPERFDLELTVYEEKVTNKLVQIFSEARNVFLNVQNWLDQAAKYFVINEHCSDYIEIVQDHSKAYKLLAFFELDIDRQCKMHKRRVDLLLGVLNQLNPQHYLLVCRQLMFELAETYSTMLDLKLVKLEDGGSPSVHAMQKINSLAFQSIKQFQAFLDSFKDGKGNLPEEFSDMDTRPVMVAMCCLGRLYSKLMFPDVSKRLSYLQQSLHYYQMLVSYCSRSTRCREAAPSEYDVCQEMVQLLPLKLAKLASET